MFFLSLPLKRCSFFGLKSVFIRLGPSLWPFPLSVRLRGCGLVGAVWATGSGGGERGGGEAGEGGKTGGKTRLFRGRLGRIALWLDAASHFFFC